MRFRRTLRGGRKLSTCLSPLVCLIAAALPVFSSAQQPAMQSTGQITGTVTESDGAVATGATIAPESQLTREQITSKSDGTGFFKFTALLPECSKSPSAQRGSRIGQQLKSFSNRAKTTSWPTSR
jgi:hypothetical protein